MYLIISNSACMLAAVISESQKGRAAACDYTIEEEE